MNQTPMNQPRTRLPENPRLINNAATSSVEVRQAASELEALAKENRARVPERVFACVFLPFFFSGEVHEQYKADLSTWVTIAGGGNLGGAYKEVDIIDAQGNVLYTVPPIHNASAIKPAINSKAGMWAAVQDADRYSAIHPSRGIQHLEQELAKRDIFKWDPSFFHANAEAWNQIFTRYGYPTIGNSVPEAEAVKLKEKESVANYDEWEEA
jgi:hypothetical protein